MLQAHGRDAGPKLGVDVAVFGLDGQALLNVDLIVRIVEIEVEVLQDQSHHEERFLPGKRASNAGSQTGSKWLAGTVSYCI